MGSQTPRSPAAPRHSGAPDIAFDHEKSLGTFGTYQFRPSIPCPHAPLPTLHRHPHGYRCTARGESWIGSSFFPETLTLTPPPVSLAHSHPDCRAAAIGAPSTCLRSVTRVPPMPTTNSSSRSAIRKSKPVSVRSVLPTNLPTRPRTQRNPPPMLLRRRTSPMPSRSTCRST